MAIQRSNKLPMPMVSIKRQRRAIQEMYPNFKVNKNRNFLKAEGPFQPTARSVSYKGLIYYRMDEPVKVTIVSPQLVRNGKGDQIPHMYEQERLCLFLPSNREFSASDLIAETIIPWTVLWLYHYENWHLTGEWQGGGIH